MRRRKSAFQAASPFLIAIYLILSTWLGGYLITTMITMSGGSFHTLRMVIFLILGLGIHVLIGHYGILMSGYLCGKELIMARRGAMENVLEHGQYHLRQGSLECSLIPFVMVSKRGRETGGLYFLGGVVCNLILVLLSVILLMSDVIDPNSYVGSFFLAFIMAGLWVVAMEGFPAYHGNEPNCGLKAWILMTDPKAAYSYEQDMLFLRYMAHGKMEKACQIEYPDLTEDDDNEPMSLFRAAYLLRVYEVLVWAGSYDDASDILANVYYHFFDFPEEWQQVLMEEVAFFLLLKGGEEEESLSNEILTKDRRRILEQENTFSSLKTLFLWAKDNDADKGEEYFEKIKEASRMIPFKGARIAWQVVLGLRG